MQKVPLIGVGKSLQRSQETRLLPSAAEAGQQQLEPARLQSRISCSGVTGLAAVG